MHLPPRAAMLRVCHATMSPVSSVWKVLIGELVYIVVKVMERHCLSYNATLRVSRMEDFCRCRGRTSIGDNVD
jgi:hypothetical protein